MHWMKKLALFRIPYDTRTVTERFGLIKTILKLFFAKFLVDYCSFPVLASFLVLTTFCRNYKRLATWKCQTWTWERRSKWTWKGRNWLKEGRKMQSVGRDGDNTVTYLSACSSSSPPICRQKRTFAMVTSFCWCPDPVMLSFDNSFSLCLKVFPLERLGPCFALELDRQLDQCLWDHYCHESFWFLVCGWGSAMAIQDRSSVISSDGLTLVKFLL